MKWKTYLFKSIRRAETKTARGTKTPEVGAERQTNSLQPLFPWKHLLALGLSWQEAAVRDKKPAELWATFQGWSKRPRKPKGPETHALLLLSCEVGPDSLQPHGQQHARLPCSSLSAGACSDLCPLSWWCYPTISFSVAPFSSCPQSFPASGTFLISLLFALGGQSIGVLCLVSPSKYLVNSGLS